MNFAESEVQTDTRDLARRIFEQRMGSQELAGFDDAPEGRFDSSLWRTLAEAGLLGISVSDLHGGMGLEFAALAPLLEEAGRALAPVPIIEHVVLAVAAIEIYGDRQQCERWLPAALAGDSLFTAALPHAAEVNCTPEGEALRLNGSVALVPLANLAQYILLVVPADRGQNVLLVDPRAPGVTLHPQRFTTGETRFSLSLDDVLVPPEQLLATAAAGQAAGQWLLQRALTAHCLHQLGVCERMLEMTAAYTGERQQFGVPIATFQAVGHRAANIYIDLECLRLTARQAASRLSQELAADTEIAIAKVWAGDVGHRTSYAAQHLHGGTGIDRDYPLWRYCLFARANELALGGSACHLSTLGEIIAAGGARCS